MRAALRSALRSSASSMRWMREDWRQLRIQRIEDAEERKAERKAARNGVTFESVSH